MVIWVTYGHNRITSLPKDIDFLKTISVCIDETDDRQMQIFEEILSEHGNAFGILESQNIGTLWFIEEDSALYLEIRLKCVDFCRLGSEGYYRLDHELKIDYNTRHLKSIFDITF